MNVIMVGLATVPAHEDGGYALPGGGVTHCKQTALTVAKNLSRMIGEDVPVGVVREQRVSVTRVVRRTKATEPLDYMQI